ncbi:DNA polymerase [Ignicoccus pacificus DSM 13166]|uniref:DNA polymerase n=1 Tax=Ignicoccus pacificus DSM 13166 TaxID=940294 RepID=A0A977PJT8_9CREN|nr:DNA polymerase [Ignicoccus pacificus DSM 13166]
MSWIRYHVEHLKRWREVAEKFFKAARDLYPESEVYVIGSVAEGRHTVTSDVDILICFPEGIDVRRAKKKVILRAMDVYDVPWDYPFEVHAYTMSECEKVKRVSGKVVRIG